MHFGLKMLKMLMLGDFLTNVSNTGYICLLNGVQTEDITHEIVERYTHQQNKKKYIYITTTYYLLK